MTTSPTTENKTITLSTVKADEIDVSIVIVNYNVADLLLACIRSIKKETVSTHEIIVCDNNSSDNSVELIGNNYPDIKLIVNSSNNGFAKANNQAIRCSKGRYVLLLNPDTVVTEGAIDKMISFMDLHADIGACGPTILNPDMTLQPNCHHFPSFLIRFSKYTGLNRKYPKNKLFGREFMTYWNYHEIREVDWLTGCALLLRKTALSIVGLLDENFFMYSEETDLCFRMHRAGFKLQFYPAAAIIHYQGQSTITCKDEIFFSASIPNYLYQSEYYFFKKNYGTVFAVSIKVFDLIYFSLIYLKNCFRIDSRIRAKKLQQASFVLSLIVKSFFTSNK